MCTYVHQKPCTRMFTVVPFILGKTGNKANVNRTNTGIFINTMECYIAIKIDKLLSYATT